MFTLVLDDMDFARHQSLWLPTARKPLHRMAFFSYSNYMFGRDKFFGMLHDLSHACIQFLSPIWIEGNDYSSAWLRARLFLSFAGLASTLIALAGSMPAPYLLIWGLTLMSLAAAFVVSWSSTERKSAEESPHRTRIRRVPGSRLLEVADFFFSRKTVERVYAPLITDLQAEYVEALAQSRPRKATWICVRGYWSFWNTVGVQSLVSTAQKVYSLWSLAKL